MYKRCSVFTVLTAFFLNLLQIPIFSKREDMFLTLCEYSVPFLRATWFIKMTSAYHESKVAESKIKKRQQPDIAQGNFNIVMVILHEWYLLPAMTKQNSACYCSISCHILIYLN